VFESQPGSFWKLKTEIYEQAGKNNGVGNSDSIFLVVLEGVREIFFPDLF
jgi:hypothetical protein